MKHVFSPACFALALSFLFISCQKDYKEVPCRILQIRSDFQSDVSPLTTNTARFEYDKAGAPTRIIKDIFGTGNTNFYFKYDQYHRLIAFSKYYTDPETNFETYTRYVYGPTLLIIRDTTWAFHFVGIPMLAKAITLYSYDAKNRISKTAIYLDDTNTPPFLVKEYSYDKKGNLVKPGAAYDNKINIHRTNPVWMFIDRDYSVNNPTPANSYNKKGLPLSFGVQSRHDEAPHLLNIFATEVTYSCYNDKDD